MKIENLKNYPQFVEEISKWIYDEFADKKSSLKIEDISRFFRNENNDKFPITFVAIENNICLGTVSVFENDLKNQNILKPWLASLYVYPNYRGRGIAEKLISHLLHEIKKVGYETIYLRTEHTAKYYLKRNWKFCYKTVDEKNLETEVYKYDLAEIEK